MEAGDLRGIEGADFLDAVDGLEPRGQRRALCVQRSRRGRTAESSRARRGAHAL